VKKPVEKLAFFVGVTCCFIALIRLNIRLLQFFFRKPLTVSS